MRRNLLASDAAGPIFFEAHDIFYKLEQVNLAAVVNLASSSMDGQGDLKAALVRFGSVEVRNLESKLRLESLPTLEEANQVRVSQFRGPLPPGKLNFLVAWIGRNEFHSHFLRCRPRAFCQEHSAMVRVA